MSPSKGGDGVPQDDWMQQTQVFRRVPEPGATAMLPPAVPSPPAGQSPPPGRRRPLRRILLVIGVVLAILVGYAALLIGLAFAGLERVDAFPDGERPPAAPGRTWLIVAPASS